MKTYLSYFCLPLVFLIGSCNNELSQEEKECLKRTYMDIQKYYYPALFECHKSLIIISSKANVDSKEARANFIKFKDSVISLSENNFANCPENVKQRMTRFFEAHDQYFQAIDRGITEKEGREFDDTRKQLLLEIKSIHDQAFNKIYEGVYNSGYSADEEREIREYLKNNDKLRAEIDSLHALN